MAALKKSLLSVYGSAQGAFEALSSSDGIVGRKQWKRAVKKASLSDHFGSIQLKELRSSLPKLASLSAFCNFVDGSAVALLSVRESVELLSAVAQLDTSEVSPCMIEIVRQHAVIAAADLELRD